MPSYPIHTIATAPETARPVLEHLEKTFGMVPDLAGAPWRIRRS